MFKSILFLVTLIVTIYVVNGIHIDIDIDYHNPSGNNQFKSLFEEWRMKHGKTYSTPKEYMIRFANFKETHKSIQELNKIHEGSAKFAHNSFSDLSKDEFTNRYLMRNYKPNLIKPQKPQHLHEIHKKNPLSYVGDNVPLLSIDWRTQGLVTPVKNQGACGSCWAFSCTEQIESAWIKAGNSEEILSEQQIVDCDTNDGGCGGGDTATCFEYVIGAGGLTTEKAYPYVANDEKCEDNFTTVAHIASYYPAADQGNDTQLALSIASEGPVSICVDASSWMSYSSGIITKSCGIDLDHCVQVVGLEVDTNSTTPIPYFIIRNSWGTDWGIEGYIYVEVGKDLCGVSQEAYLVTV